MSFRRYCLTLVKEYGQWNNLNAPIIRQSRATRSTNPQLQLTGSAELRGLFNMTKLVILPDHWWNSYNRCQRTVDEFQV